LLYAITFDLNKAGQDYNSLYQAIRDLGPTIRPLQNLWIAQTTKSATEITELLMRVIDSNDRLFVVRVNAGQWDCYMLQSDINWIYARS